MKNFGKYLWCLIYLSACSTASVTEVKLSDGKKGYDVNCLGDLSKCQERARVLCQGRYRVHNTYAEGPLYSLTKEAGLVMRLQCLEDQASLEQCSEPGIRCIL